LSVALSLAALPVAAATLACQRASESRPRSVAARGETAADHSAHAGQAAGPPQPVLPVNAASVGAPARDVFTGSFDEVKSLIALSEDSSRTGGARRLEVAPRPKGGSS